MLIGLRVPILGAVPVEKVAFGQGVVVCDDPVVAQIGADILARGGTAVDAAVAVGFALAVTFPQAGNIGGGGFMVVYTPGEGSVVLDFREVAPQAATPEMYLDASGRVRPRASLDGYLAVGVPGTVAGLYAAHRRWGRFPWADLIAPAIRLAEQGFATNTRLYLDLMRDRTRLLRDPEFRRIFYTHGMPRAYIVQPDLARTLRYIASNGARGFYTGPVAEAIVRAMRAHGGIITRTDLAAYTVRWRTPIRFRIRDVTVHTMPLPSAGGWIIRFLFHVLDPHRDIMQYWHSSLHINLVVEAFKRAYAIRATYMGDPDFIRWPSFLDRPEWMASVAAALRPYRVTPSSALAADRWVHAESPDTTHFSIVDTHGQAVAVTYTLNSRFGAGVIVPGTGVILNNEMDDFSIRPGVPNQFGLTGSVANAIAPGKRMLSSMTPTIVTRNRRVIGVLGSPGGSTIITVVYQVLENLLIFRMQPLTALMAPRFHHQWLPDVIFHEPTALTGDTRRILQGLGYPPKPLETLGRVQMIWQYDGGYLGLSDPRSPGGGAAVRVDSDRE